MTLNLQSSNVVINAKQFNPSIFKERWLIANNIVGADEFSDGCVYTDIVAHIFTPGFNFVVVPQQLQFMPRLLANDVEDAKLIDNKLGAVVNTLRHTPYTALGLNFNYQMNDEHLPELSKKLFYDDRNALFREFNTDDARFGCYMSKDFRGYRLKLDVKPLSLKDPEGKITEFLQFAFNYHLDIAGEIPHQEVINALKDWQPAKSETERILSRITQ